MLIIRRCCFADADSDMSKHVPTGVWPEKSALVEKTADLLSEVSDYYFFCSSIAVYTTFRRPGLTEKAATLVRDFSSYAGEKARAEKHVQTRFSDRYGIAKCHSILGPRDTVSHFNIGSNGLLNSMRS